MDISPINVKNFISSRMSSGGMYHAVILSGRPCREKDEVISALAAAIVCRGENKPCGLCRDCVKARQNVHPDIYYVTAAKDKSGAEKNNIEVDIIRDMRTTVPILPNDSDNKVYIIQNAEKMNAASQNVLLKTIEEPPSFAYFILSADDASHLLPTVRSRCAEIRCSAGGEKTDEAAENSADEIIDTYLGGKTIDMVSLIASFEKTDKNLFYGILTAVRSAAMARLKSGQTEREKLKNLISCAEECLKYLDMNVSMVHVLGLMMKCLA